jgi:hypothetical protein
MPYTGVTNEETQSNRRLLAYRSVPLIFLLVTIILFWSEIAATFGFFFGIFKALFFGDLLPVLSPEVSRSILTVLFNFFFSFCLLFLFWLLQVSFRALLPVTTLDDKLKTTENLFFYLLGMYGPAVFIKDGRIHAEFNELFRGGSGVVTVDYNSAVVLERSVGSPGCLGLFFGALRMPREVLARMSNHPQASPSYESTRVCGPGVTFTTGGERIRGVGDLVSEEDLENICGVVDLRNQYRVNQKDLSKSGEKTRVPIHGYTRDGIELTTNVWALFTIGQDPEPDALQVTYLGEHRLENLRVVALEPSPDKKLRIRSLDDTLDLEDKREIHQFARIAARMGQLKPFEPLPPRPDTPVFNAGRVFSAVFSRARTPEDKVIPWNDLPTRMAIDYFRQFLSTYNYNQLYQPDSVVSMPVEDLDDLLAHSGEAEINIPAAPAPLGINLMRSQLSIALRNQGLLSYRLFLAGSGKTLKPGQSYSREQILISEIRPLTAPKVLRDRGIKIIASGFSDLKPVSDKVYQQRLDSWRATWQRDTLESQAVFELEAVRIQNRARAQAQRELTHSLSQILQNNEYSQEALAIRIFQALETLATEPATQQLLPADTINLMRTVHDWLLPGDMGSSSLARR